MAFIHIYLLSTKDLINILFFSSLFQFNILLSSCKIKLICTMNRTLPLLAILVLSFFTFSSCSDKDENQPSGPKFYLKEDYRNDQLYAQYEYDLKGRKVLKETIAGTNAPYSTFEYPSKDKVVMKYFASNNGNYTTTYTLNDKGYASTSVTEYDRDAYKLVTTNTNEYNSDGFLVKTVSKSVTTFKNSAPPSFSESETINKIENGNIVETKNIFNDTAVWTSKYSFSANTAIVYSDKNDFLGKQNKNLIESTTFSGYIQGLGKLEVSSEYINYNFDEDGLVESYSVTGGGTINGVREPTFISNYKFVFGKF